MSKNIFINENFVFKNDLFSKTCFKFSNKQNKFVNIILVFKSKTNELQGHKVDPENDLSLSFSFCTHFKSCLLLNDLWCGRFCRFSGFYSDNSCKRNAQNASVEKTQFKIINIKICNLYLIRQSIYGYQLDVSESGIGISAWRVTWNNITDN